MQQFLDQFSVPTRGAGLYEITSRVRKAAGASGILTGLMTVYCRHTSCSLLIQENADADVQTDLLGFFRRIAPENMPWIVHNTEGPDDMPAHIKAALTQVSLSIPVNSGAPMLGTWQGIYVFEHRTRPHNRDIVVHLIGEA